LNATIGILRAIPASSQKGVMNATSYIWSMWVEKNIDLKNQM